MYETIPALVERMVADLDRLPAGDARRFFHSTYLRTTRAVADEIDQGGFLDGAWLERWDIAFAQLYLDALDADLRGDPVPAPWRIAFDVARDRPALPPLRHILLGMNAHINYDLPQALIAVIAPADFDDPAIRRSRAADHTHVDTVLLARVGAEVDAPAARSACSTGCSDRSTGRPPAGCSPSPGPRSGTTPTSSTARAGTARSGTPPYSPTWRSSAPQSWSS